MSTWYSYQGDFKLEQACINLWNIIYVLSSFEFDDIYNYLYNIRR